MTMSTPISELMTLDPVCLAPNDTMDRAEKLFEKHGIHHLPVVENGRLIGMVAFTDDLKLVREIFGGKDEIHQNKLITSSIIARDCMSKKLFSLNPDDSLGDAIHVFREKTSDGDSRCQKLADWSASSPRSTCSARSKNCCSGWRIWRGRCLRDVFAFLLKANL